VVNIDPLGGHPKGGEAVALDGETLGIGGASGVPDE